MSRRKTALFAAGGTGGHIFPALAVAEELRTRHDDVEIAFVGSRRRMEADLVPKAGFRFIPVTAAGFPHGITLRWIPAIAALKIGLLQVARILIREKPSVVFGTGGYVCGPLVGAAAVCGIPTVIHEGNAVPGLTNAWLGKVVTRVLVGFKEAAPHFPAGKTRVVGNPIRPDIVSACARKPERPIESSQVTVLVMGGSLGAHRINVAVVDALAELANMPVRLVHQTGRRDYEYVRVSYDKFFATLDASSGIPERFELLPFIDDPGGRFAEADLMICRSGAMTVSEAMLCGVPCIMVPFPSAKRDEQSRNAEAVVKAGAGVVIEDARFDGARLIEELRPYVDSGELLRQAAAGCQHIARPSATEEIARTLEDFLH